MTDDKVHLRLFKDATKALCDGSEQGAYSDSDPLHVSCVACLRAALKAAQARISRLEDMLEES